MTIQDIYDWAKEHNCLDVPVAKHINTDFVDVNTVIHLKDELPDLYSGQNDRVVLD